nr:hypothetical protein [uncultured Clostridium sp.]
MVATLGWYIQKKDKEKAIVDAEIRERNNKERDMLIASIEKNRLVNEKLLEANKELAESNRLLINEFSTKINNIENNVVEIKEQIRM